MRFVKLTEDNGSVLHFCLDNVDMIAKVHPSRTYPEPEDDVRIGIRVGAEIIHVFLDYRNYELLVGHYTHSPDFPPRNLIEITSSRYDPEE